MKKNEVPQDDENLFEGKFKVVKYALDDDGNYGTVGSSGWEPENTVLNQAWDEINKKVEATLKKIQSGINGRIIDEGVNFTRSEPVIETVPSTVLK